MIQQELKRQVAQAALSYVQEDTVIGVGTGSTANFFIEALGTIKHRIEGAVASSVATERLLRAQGIPVFDLNAVNDVLLYVDGADEANKLRQLIKGGGGALTREKILAAASKQFICIMDESKKVDVLGSFPLPIEVIPMARGYVSRQLVRLGGQPVYREDYKTDNGNIILDVYQLSITEPINLEAQLNNITGVVCNGLFAKRPADILLIATPNGVETVF